MGKEVAEIQAILDRDSLASDISDLYVTWASARNKKIDDIKELRNYLFATDTTTTTNSSLPWKNKTTRPKLTHIRDMLHANYMNALFPNDRWLQWEAYSREESDKSKKEAIEAYMDNKLREGNFISIMSTLLYDYIDNGNVFADCEFFNEVTTNADGEVIQGFRGPKAKRLSIFDHVFNISSPNYASSTKITRFLKSIGDLNKEIQDRPELAPLNKDIVNKIVGIRGQLKGYTGVEVDKSVGFEIDGFGSMSQYYQSGMVELLQFEGSLYDEKTETFHSGREIWIVDRSYVIYNEPIRTWSGKSTKVHTGWRIRPDNIFAMGPLDNLVGMQYRIDHLENLAADAMDLAVMPPIGLRGAVDDFEWKPGAQVYLGDDGDIVELGKNLSAVISAENKIEQLEQKMEEYAGAPKQAAGIRTPGEKTAFEVQALENAAGRVFQHKINQFEREVIEPLLNNMLEMARRNMGTKDVVRVLDNDLGVTKFIEITKEDLTAKGKLRPIGARHFATNAQLLQTLTQLSNTSLFQEQAFKTHFSFKNLARGVEALLGVERFDLVSDNALVFEQAETQKLMNEAGGEIDATQATPLPEEEII